MSLDLRWSRVYLHHKSGPSHVLTHPVVSNLIPFNPRKNILGKVALLKSLSYPLIPSCCFFHSQSLQMSARASSRLTPELFGRVSEAVRCHNQFCSALYGVSARLDSQLGIKLVEIVRLPMLKSPSCANHDLLHLSVRDGSSEHPDAICILHARSLVARILVCRQAP